MLFITVLASCWALGLLVVIYTVVTQFGTLCGPGFDPMAWCRWSVRPFLGVLDTFPIGCDMYCLQPNTCDCRLVVGRTHTVDEEKGESKCVALPEVITIRFNANTREYSYPDVDGSSHRMNAWFFHTVSARNLRFR